MATAIRRVGLNALFLAPGRSGGPETYLRQLAPALAREFPSVRFAVATTRSGAAALRRDGFGDFLEIHALPAEDGQRGRRTVAEQGMLPLLARRWGWDVLHSLASVAPIHPSTRAVITLHDVTFMHMRSFDPVTTWGMSQIVRRASRRARVLIASSDAARDDICAALSLDPDRFLVVPLGVGRPGGAGTGSADGVRERHALGDARVVLCVAAKRPHKNQELLVRAVDRLPHDVVVVLAGEPEPYDAKLRRIADELGVRSRVRFVDYVPDPQLEDLWRIAACAAFPTLAEGFGLPVLEAMQRGVPVACSDIPVLREVAGSSARYFDPRDPGQAAEAIVDAMDDRSLIAGGRERAAGFSWEAAAHGTFDAYERAVASD